MHTHCIRHFHVMRRDLVYLKFIIEAHEGLATLSTADKLGSIVRISYHYLFSEAMESLLAAVQQEIPMLETTAACLGSAAADQLNAG